MAVTFEEMVDFVRLQGDADEVDAPDDLLKVHARVGYRWILDQRKSWDHLEVAYTLTTADGTAAYPFTGFAGGTDLERVFSVSCLDGGGRELTPMTRSDAEGIFGVVPSEAEFPEAFVVSNGNIVLYPTPSGVHDYRVRGVRRPSDWPTTAGSAPDLPDRFHDAIQWYMLSGYFTAQEDVQLAGLYMNEFQQMVDDSLKATANMTRSARVSVVGGADLSRQRVVYLDI